MAFLPCKEDRMVPKAPAMVVRTLHSPRGCVSSALQIAMGSEETSGQFAEAIC